MIHNFYTKFKLDGERLNGLNHPKAWFKHLWMAFQFFNQPSGLPTLAAVQSKRHRHGHGAAPTPRLPQSAQRKHSQLTCSDSESFKCPPEAIQTKNGSLSMFLVAQHWRPSSGSFNRQSKSFTSSTQLPWPLGQYDPATPPHKRCESSLLLRKTIGQPRVKQVWHLPFSCFAQS